VFIIICGGGKVGNSLARQLLNPQNKIYLMEKDTDVCERLAKELTDINIINADACEPHNLENAQADKADVVVAVTGDDEDNLVICQLAKTYFSVKRTIARVNDSRNEETFIKLGVDIPINSTKIIAQAINHEVSLEELNTLLKFRQGKLSIVQGKVTPASQLAHKQLKDLQMPKDCIIVSILRGDDIIVPHGDTLIEANDEILAVTSGDSEKHFYKLLVG